MAIFTKRFSAEFAIRHFFNHDWQRALDKALHWANDSNHHVRRLASEGSRPRLPWGLQLSQFIEDPFPLLPLLNKLKDDPEEYVRRSVANNINDIAKDHPDLVASTAKSWMVGANRDQIRMIKHACRTLVKAGHKPTLEALGYGPPMVELNGLTIATPNVVLGGALEFSIEVKSLAKSAQPLIIDFNIHHLKANGDTAPKTFKWKILDLKPGQSLSLSKKHPMKPITTRKFYSGEHKLEIQINGESFGKLDFVLEV